MTASDRDLVIDKQQKVVIGRPSSFIQISRVARDIGPILRDAINQPSIRATVAQDASGAGLPLDDFKRFFVQKQEADILLESGGDPDALSHAGAAGVAQWLAGTGRGAGKLRIDERRSRTLTAAIEARYNELQLLRGQPPEFSELWPTPQTVSAAAAAASSRPAHSALPPAAPREAVPDNTVELAPQMRSRDAIIGILQNDIQLLSAERQRIDERYDPRLALFAQTRYLVRMWKNYPSLDWVFEAYHGGEAGVRRTLVSFLGPAWARAGTVSHAILGEDRLGRKITEPLTFERIFFTTSPRSHRAAFAYLYGLHDEHRTYWFKLLMAEKAIAWFRRNSSSLRDQWQALRPGYPIDDAWYPDAPERSFADARAVREAVRKGTLVEAPPIPGVVRGSVPFLPAELQSQLAVSRPECFGALALVASTYRRESTHPMALTLAGMTEPLNFTERLRAQFPPAPPKTPPEPSAVPAADLPDMHALGSAIDIFKPSDPWEARVLQYALSYWEDRERLHFNSESWGKTQVWRIVPNPHFAQSLRRRIQSAA